MAEDLTRALALLREQRHSFMNHLQVIHGWLQLGKADRAIQYIDRAAARMEAEGQVLQRVEAPEVGIFILTAGMDAEPYGVALEWRLTGPVDPAQLGQGRELIFSALTEAAKLPEGERRLVISLGPTIAVHTPFDVGEG